MIQYDSPLMAGINKVVDIFWLSILFAVCCLPIVTIGASISALYYTTVKSLRRNREYVTKTFFHAFRMNLVPSLGMWLFFGGMAVLFYCGFVFAAAIEDSSFRFFVFCVYLFLAFLALGTACYAFPVLSRCSMRCGEILRFSVGLMVKHFPYTLLLSLIALFCVFGIWYFPLFLFCLPSVGSLCYSWFMERILVRYTPESNKESWYMEKG